MGQICSICGFKEKPQQATANVEISLRGIQASHQSQQPHYYSRLFNYLFTNISNSANAPFFLYTEGATVPHDAIYVRVDPSVTVIPADAFRYRRQLKEFILPEGLQEIGARAFYDCNSLERINFPSTLTAISIAAFDGCTSLREVKLSKSNVTSIGARAFCDCSSLKRINFPSTLTEIGYQAFWNCTSLREVKLVGGILDMGGCAFWNCRSLKRIAIPSKAFVIENGAINCRLLTTGTITPTRETNWARTYYGQLVIASKCFESMSMTDLAEVENAINEIIDNLDQSVRTTRVILERIRALFAHYELVEAMTILELALWKAKVDEVDDLNAREECRFICGAGIIIPIVLPFL